MTNQASQQRRRSVARAVNRKKTAWTRGASNKSAQPLSSDDLALSHEPSPKPPCQRNATRSLLTQLKPCSLAWSPARSPSRRFNAPFVRGAWLCPIVRSRHVRAMSEFLAESRTRDSL